jgi:hypothetical protein
MKTRRATIYLTTQRTNWRILTSAKKIGSIACCTVAFASSSNISILIGQQIVY